MGARLALLAATALVCIAPAARAQNNSFYMTGGGCVYGTTDGTCAKGSAVAMWINLVADKGADPTGVADSSTAWANAWTAACAASNGAVIYEPPGRYDIVSGILIPDGCKNVTVKAQPGTATMVADATNTSAALFARSTAGLAGASYITFEGVTFDGSVATIGSASPLFQFYAPSHHIVFDNNTRFQNTRGIPVAFTGGANLSGLVSPAFAGGSATVTLSANITGLHAGARCYSFGMVPGRSVASINTGATQITFDASISDYMANNTSLKCTPAAQIAADAASGATTITLDTATNILANQTIVQSPEIVGTASCIQPNTTITAFNSGTKVATLSKKLTCPITNASGQLFAMIGGVQYSGVRDSTFSLTGVYCLPAYGNTGNLIDCNGSVVYSNGAEFANIGNFATNNEFVNTGSDGVDAQFIGDSTVALNRFKLGLYGWHPTSGAYAGIACVYTLSSSNVTIANNKCEGATGNGFDTSSSRGVNLIGNDSVRNGAAGIGLCSITDFAIEGSILKENGQAVNFSPAAAFDIDAISMISCAGAGHVGTLTNGTIATNTISDNQTVPTQQYGMGLYTGEVLVNVKINQDNAISGNVAGSYSTTTGNYQAVTPFFYPATITEYTSAGTFTYTIPTAASRLRISLWGGGGGGANGIACGAAASCGGGGSGGGGGTAESADIQISTLIAASITSCTVVVGAGATHNSGAAGSTTTVTCGANNVWHAMGGGTGSQGATSTASGGGGGGSVVTAGGNGSGATGGAAGTPAAGTNGLGGGGAVGGTGQMPIGSGGSGSSATGVAAPGTNSYRSPASGGAGGGCNAGAAANGGNAGMNELQKQAVHGSPGGNGYSPTDGTSGAGGGGGDAATGSTNGGAGGNGGSPGGGGGGGGNNCNGGTGAGGNGGDGGAGKVTISAT